MDGMTTRLPPPAGPRRRSRARTVVPLALVASAVLEIWLLTVVADATSGLLVLLLLLAGLVLGALAVKRAGRSAWRALTGSGRPGEPPPRATGAMLPMLGGLLLMVPGLVSDVLGLLCLFPPTRSLLRRPADRFLGRRLPDPGPIGDLFRQAREADEQARMHRSDGKVIPGEVIGEVVDSERERPAQR